MSNKSLHRTGKPVSEVNRYVKEGIALKIKDKAYIVLQKLGGRTTEPS